MTDRAVQHDTLVMERSFDAEPTRVFAAWATAEARRQWGSPNDEWVVADDEDDFRVGGHVVSRFGPPGDPRFRAETNYLDIVENSRIVMAGTMSDRNRHISASLSTVELYEVGNRTRMIYTEQTAFLDGLDNLDSRRTGWTTLFDHLEKFLLNARVPQ